MANLRSLMTIGAVLGSVLMLSLAPAVVGSTGVTPAMAEPQAASGAPLKLAPPRQARTVTRHTRKFKRTARIRLPQVKAEMNFGPRIPGHQVEVRQKANHLT